MPNKSGVVTSSLEIQVRFFEALKQLLPANTQFAESISQLLDISLDSAYRRIRGETVIGIDETVKLCSHFNYPLSALGMSMPNLVTFYVNQLGDKMDTFEKYLTSMANDVKLLSQSSDGHITYAAEDIPVFYHFTHKHLLYFKMFYWMKAIQNVTDLPRESYHPEMFGDFFETKGRVLFQLYGSTPSTEIWTKETVLSTLNQIKFFWDSGFITEAEHLEMICDDLSAMLDVVKKQANTGHKYLSPNKESNKAYQLYISDLLIATNSIVTRKDGKRYSYLSYNTFNSIKTSNDFFADQTEKWLDNLVSKSTLISVVGEKQRNQFFRGMQQKVAEFKQKMLEDS
jgi:hypothetical protein